MEQLVQMIKATIELVEETANLFYQQKQQEGLQKLDIMLINIMALLENIQSFQKNHRSIILEEVQINTVLTYALDVLAQQDYVLLADVLTFELNSVIGDSLSDLQNYANSSQ